MRHKQTKNNKTKAWLRSPSVPSGWEMYRPSPQLLGPAQEKRAMTTKGGEGNPYFWLKVTPVLMMMMKCRYATLVWPSGVSIQLRRQTAEHSVAPSLTFRLRTGEISTLLAPQSSMSTALESCCGNWWLKTCLSLVKMDAKVSFYSGANNVYARLM